MSLSPNPMYIFREEERDVLKGVYMRAGLVDSSSVRLGNINFRHKTGSLSFKLNNRGHPDVIGIETLFSSIQEDGAEKIILDGFFPSTLNIPHHIHEDASREDFPERKGPMRTYFDGSSLQTLGHAVAICIDNIAGTITTQCPWGYDFSEMGEEILQGAYPQYGRITLRHKQQEDTHSCAVLTLHNMFSMAGIHPAQEKIDIRAWRSELLGHLRGHEEKHGPVAEEFPLTPDELRSSYGHTNPIFRQRYA